MGCLAYKRHAPYSQRKVVVLSSSSGKKFPPVLWLIAYPKSVYEKNVLHHAHLLVKMHWSDHKTTRFWINTHRIVLYISCRNGCNRRQNWCKGPCYLANLKEALALRWQMLVEEERLEKLFLPMKYLCSEFTCPLAYWDKLWLQDGHLWACWNLRGFAAARVPHGMCIWMRLPLQYPPALWLTPAASCTFLAG